MRKLVLLSGLLLSGALLTGSPALADVGCTCAKFGQAPVCVSSIAACAQMSGLCVAPCDYKAPKKMVKRHRAKKMAKKPAPKAMKPAPKAMKKPAEKKPM